MWKEEEEEMLKTGVIRMKQVLAWWVLPKGQMEDHSCAEHGSSQPVVVKKATISSQEKKQNYVCLKKGRKHKYWCYNEQRCKFQ